MKAPHPGGAAQHFKTGRTAAFEPHDATAIGMLGVPGHVEMAATATACAAVVLFPRRMHGR